MPEQSIYLVLAFIPIVLLIILSLLRDIRFAAVATFLLTTVLFFVWKSPMSMYLASLGASLVSTIQILLIVFGAVFLYESMNKTGYIANINQSITEITPLKEIGFFIIAIGLTGFFEGVSGFGTPGAIVPLLLISMGFSPLLSIATVLLFDGLFAAFGAVGTPLLAGLKVPLSLNDEQIISTAFYASIFLSVAGIVFMQLVIKLFEKEETIISSKGRVWMLFFICFLPFIICARLLPEFSSILAPLFVPVFGVLYFSKEKISGKFKSWMPYLVLVVLLILPKIIKPLGSMLDREFIPENLFAAEISSSLKLLQSPLIPFSIVALIFAESKKKTMESLSVAGKKLVAVGVLLFPVIAVAQLMMHSGYQTPSMIQCISYTFSNTGDFYVIIAPIIGIIGAFVTGSSTVSNIVFGPSQLETAHLLTLNDTLVLALQLAGGSIGNAICLFNIIAACSVAGFNKPNKVLVRNFWPATIGGLILGIIAFIIVKFG